MKKVTDWKRIAADRLDTIHQLRREREILSEKLEARLVSAMETMFHAKCYPRNLYEYEVHDMAKFIAERMVKP